LEKELRVLAWGTYDLGKPRTRILLQGFLLNHVLLEECHSNVWAGVEDKSQIRNLSTIIRFFLKWLYAYPDLIWRFLRTTKPDVVFIGYLGQLDVLVLWPFAKMRSVPVIWDAHLSLYSTVVEDRKMIKSTNLLARFLFLWEWVACKTADFVLLDTQAHVRYFIEKFKVRREKIGSVYVGAEPDYFYPEIEGNGAPVTDDSITAFFFGQFIPLHGIETIILAAQQMNNPRVNWLIAGKGQVEAQIRQMLDDNPVENLIWVPWVPHEELFKEIHAADVCLGIFGDSDKASRVIPNKVFQIIACGCPLITRDSPAIRELITPPYKGIYLVPPSDPDALIQAINLFIEDLDELRKAELFSDIQGLIHPAAIGKALLDIINREIIQPKNL